MAEFERIDGIEIPDRGPDCYDFSVLFEQSDDKPVTFRVNIVEMFEGDLDESVLTDMEVGENSGYIDFSERHGEY